MGCIMDYIVTFEDGSEGYLTHHGIKGMHWGVRNQETQMKYAGGNGGQVKGTGENPYSRIKSVAKTAAYVGYVGIPKKAAGSIKKKLTPSDPREAKRVATSEKKRSSDDAMMDFARKGGFGLAGIAYAKSKDRKAGASDPREAKRVVTKPKTQKTNAVSKKDFARNVVENTVWQTTHPIKNAKNGVALAKAGARAIQKNRTAAKNLTAKTNALKDKNDLNAVMKLAREYDKERKSPSLSSASSRAFKENPSLTYDKIYKEMKINTRSEDPDAYRNAEEAWMKKHGYM